MCEHVEQNNDPNNGSPRASCAQNTPAGASFWAEETTDSADELREPAAETQEEAAPSPASTVAATSEISGPTAHAEEEAKQPPWPTEGEDEDEDEDDDALADPIWGDEMEVAGPVGEAQGGGRGDEPAEGENLLHDPLTCEGCQEMKRKQWVRRGRGVWVQMDN